jgi:DNA-3-methyladenine glycosylase I
LFPAPAYVKHWLGWPAMDGTVAGADGLARCPWGAAPPEYVAYHDREWGRVVSDDRAIFEKICLEGFQSGLSWLTVLRKRPAFRAAFAGFDAAVVARFGKGEVAGLLADAGIIRHRAKIEAAIANARALTSMWERGLALSAVLWSHEPVRAQEAPVVLADVPAWTPESKSLAAELAGLGFRFVGPRTAYATMQSLGVVNDHLAGCYCRAECEAERGRR